MALLSPLVVPLADAQAAVPEAESAELSEGQTALSEAAESGKRVEVTGERSERTTVFANPDGYTFTLQESSVPVRVVKPGGGWQLPDATLVKREDGSVAPKAAAPQIVFSGGGDREPLARIAHTGRSLELEWPGTLPEPKLDGASALYAEVFPDVDLKVTATVESFKHVLVVKSRKAAASAELEKLTFGLRTEGLKVREGNAGNVTAVDSDGNAVFKAPPARMWDSAGKAAKDQAPSTQRALADAGDPADPSESAPSGSGVEPGQGDAVARMDVKVTEGLLSVTPDAGMLAQSDASKFPLFIDPSVTWGESERTLLRSDGYEDYAWGNGEDDLGKGAGKCGTWNGYYCGPGYVQRLYFEFSPASLKGKRVLDTTFRVTEPWAFQCDPRWVDLIRTKDNISSSTTWASRPGGWDTMGDRLVSAGRGSLCDPDSPDAPIEFNDNPDESNENLTPTVRDFAAGKFDRLTLMVKAHDETDTSAWKRFRNDAVLEVDFVGLPDKPTGVGLAAGTGTVCEKSETDQAIVSNPRPLLRATTQTKAGGESGAQLRINYDIDQKNASDGTWSDTTPPGTGDLMPPSGYAGDGRALALSWSTLNDGSLYRYRAWVRSYYNGGNSFLSGPSNATTTGWCYFKVDSSAPKAPQIAISDPYRACTAEACMPNGGPGQKATFTFSPDTTDTNVVRYQYKLPDQDTWTSKTGSTVSVEFTPQRSGTHTLQVHAVDNVGSGRPGADNTVEFLVAAGEGPIGRWRFDEASGAAKDSATAGGTTRHDAVLGGGAVRDDRGRRGLITHDAQGLPLENAVTDKGLALNGSTGYAATQSPVLETRSAYTLSAWVRLDSLTKPATVLGQTGPDGNAFALWYLADTKKWYFGVRAVGASGYQGRYSVYEAQANVWTHLAATYDPVKGEQVFYVDGRRQGTPLAVSQSVTTDQPLQFGRLQLTSSYTYHLPGSIDEVAVWQRALEPEEVAEEAQLLTSQTFAAAELVADWDASRGSGTTVADTTSGYGRPLTLSSGASLDGSAIVLDGVDDAATANGPLVYDHAAFTVSTVARLNGAALADKDVGYIGQVLGQRTADGSAWGIWYELTGKETVLDDETFEEKTVSVGKWHFGRLNADGTFSSVVSDEAAAPDTSVRLTGIYNSLNGTISLYLGHNQNGDAEEFTVKLGTGDFALGKAFNGDAWKHYLPVRVAEVRLWAGAMAGSEQIDATIGG
ncbi:LamG-like jellyroll fold domain-containing protein [Streptomyces sp. NBC_00878]|uniref:LamG-like jellyroll fold domain-containing protein n=1 Tax=Streptomyces sp. NBC_00878 TaxID=2975854 RepID=UPI002251F213|nr:LamG-like jellyroll fold domain-containing protein [Streptomyces sp. NBC_00878]MCX4905731.1 LamG domain protein jellyroll fold domain protein [Streptomyces sp. NBC_00878]